MRMIDGDKELYQRLEGAVAFRLFGDSGLPTLTVAEQIAAGIGDSIIAGVLAPGVRIIEQELASEFNVSRGPVREAIRILEREGLVTVLARHGAMVTMLTSAEVEEIFEIRAGLMEIVWRKVIHARHDDKSVELIAALKAGVAQLRRLASLNDDQGAYAETSYRLSLIAARRCGNDRLARMVRSLALQTLRYSKLGFESRERREQSAALWSEAMTTLDQGNVPRFIDLARQRLTDSGAAAAGVLKIREARAAKAVVKVPHHG